MDDKIKLIISTILDTNVDHILPDTPLIEIDNWDSIKHLHLVLNIEDKFNVRLRSDDFAKMTSIDAIKVIISMRNTKR